MIKNVQFSFLMLSELQVLNVTHGNLFSNQSVVTMLESEVFKYNF